MMVALKAVLTVACLDLRKVEWRAAELVDVWAASKVGMKVATRVVGKAKMTVGMKDSIAVVVMGAKKVGKMAEKLDNYVVVVRVDWMVDQSVDPLADLMVGNLVECSVAVLAAM